MGEFGILKIEPLLELTELSFVEGCRIKKKLRVNDTHYRYDKPCITYSQFIFVFAKSQFLEESL